MNLTQIKKALYKEKPIAILKERTKAGLHYEAVCTEGIVNFVVPYDEVGEDLFTATMESQLLIRWIKLS